MARRISKELTKAELLAKIEAIEADPKSKNPPGSSWIYTEYARAKLDKLRRSVASIIRSERIVRGETVNDAGYSGRNSNRR